MKYVESFQATPRNLTVLVYDRFGLDLPALSEQVKEALTLLESQTYIQRNGNAYEYLTNEEQEIEQEIKNVDIDASEVSARLFKILSGDVIKTNRIRYAKNGQDFPFGFKLDDQPTASSGSCRFTSSRRSTRTRRMRSACTARARTSCASSSIRTPGCSRTSAC